MCLGNQYKIKILPQIVKEEYLINVQLSVLWDAFSCFRATTRNSLGIKSNFYVRMSLSVPAPEEIKNPIGKRWDFLFNTMMSES